MSEELHGPERARPWALVAGPLACAILLLTRPGGLDGAPLRTLAIAAWVGLWWVLEALPIAVTSLLPLVLLPLFGVRPAADVARLYMDDLLMLLLGGFLLALALERFGLHRRIALAVLSLLGTDPRRLVFGFALAAALVSMWISNSGTTVVLLPIGLAVARRLEAELSDEDRRRVDRALLLAIAYGATAGGLGTYVGTPPNLVFRERYAADFHAGSPGGPPDVSFLGWMAAFTPLAVLLALLMGVVLARGLPRGGAVASNRARAAVRAEVATLPPWSFGERFVAGLFCSAAFLWITRAKLVVDGIELPIFGWGARLFGSGDLKEPISDGTIAIALSALCFIVRVAPPPGMAGINGKRRVPILDWQEAEAKLPWGILLLFGGGFALGDAFRSSGLSKILGDALARTFTGAPAFAVILATCLFVTFISEFMNNTACAQILLPILSAVAPALRIHPAALLLPATISSSCGFMMPAGTAPNAIVFATRRIRIGDMVRIGLLLDIASAVLVTAWIEWVALPLLGIPIHAQ